jgi:hypothetical protein
VVAAREGALREAGGAAPVARTHAREPTPSPRALRGQAGALAVMGPKNADTSASQGTAGIDRSYRQGGVPWRRFRP